MPTSVVTARDPPSAGKVACNSGITAGVSERASAPVSVSLPLSTLTVLKYTASRAFAYGREQAEVEEKMSADTITLSISMHSLHQVRSPSSGKAPSSTRAKPLHRAGCIARTTSAISTRPPTFSPFLRALPPQFPPPLTEQLILSAQRLAYHSSHSFT